MKGKAVYKGGLHFVGTTESGHTLHWDSGPKDQPTNGPTPMEGVLHAVAVCSAMDVIVILKKRRKEIAAFELEIEAERRKDHPKIFEALVVVYRVGGDGITGSEVEKAVKLSHDKYCSVINMFKPGVNIGYRVELL
jgi:putative redox protein